MKQFMSNFSTTIKAFRLLSNPAVVERLTKEIQKDTPSPKLGVGNIYYHKYFMVQVVG